MRHTNDTLFDALIATAVDGIVVIDTDGTVLAYSEACERLFGHLRADVVGQDVKMLMPEPYRSAHDGYLFNHLSTGERRIIGIGREVVGLRQDGSQFPMYLSVGEGEWNGQSIYVAVIRDLSAMHAEIARREDANLLLAQIVESSDDAIVSKTLDGVVTSWNKAAESIFGYTAAEAIGRNIEFVIPPERRGEERQIQAKLRGGGSIDHFETIRRHKDGRDIDVSISVSPIRNAAGEIVGAAKIVRDVTERKRSDIKMQVLQSELAHVSRVNSMSQMSAALAHELNQPLTALSNYVRAARRTLEQPDAAAIARAGDVMDKAVAQVQRAGAIIRNLRDFVEKRESSRAPYDINQVVEEAIALGLVGAAQLGLKLRLELDRSLPPVLIDKVQIQQVLVNLFRNGIEAMQSSDVRELSIGTEADGKGFARVTVGDCGIGLTDAVQARLFQPFVTTKEKGMGIGLTICQSIVEAHGGDIVAISTAPRGAAFVFRVPFVGQREAA